jgi:hypothetical protein
MSIFPKVIENIIMDFCYQMEHKEKFQSTIQEINKINYTTGQYDEDELILSTRELPSSSYMHENHIEYYYNPMRKNRLIVESHYCFRGDSVIYSKSIETTTDGFVKIKNQGISYD